MLAEAAVPTAPLAAHGAVRARGEAKARRLGANAMGVSQVA